MRASGSSVVALAVSVVWAAASAADTSIVPRFVEDTNTSGIEHVYGGPFEFFVGGGVAVFDCNGDRRPDLFLAGGANPSALYVNRSEVGGPLVFEAVTGQTSALESVTGAYPIDVDGDAILDLAVLRVGENVMLRGRGGCAFERANEAWGIDGGDAWTTAFTARWEEGHDVPTLAFGNYIDRAHADAPFGGCSDNVLVRPAGGGYDAPQPLSPGWCALSALFSDWSRTGTADLRFSNDRQYYDGGEEQLWRIAPDAAPRLYTREDGWEQLRIWGMGIASHDVDGDSLPEVFLTSMADNKLEALVDGAGDRPRYRSISLARGVTAHRPYDSDDPRPSTAWHAEFGDVNNDGVADLFIAKGNVEAMAEAAEHDPNNLLVGLPDGTFVEHGHDAGVGSVARSRGAALVDFNLDGRLDLVVANRRANVQVWRNTTEAAGNWIALQLERAAPNRFAVGAWLEVDVGGRSLHRERTIGGGHAGGTLAALHFGIGDADAVRVRAHWSGGVTGPWFEMPANTFATLTPAGLEPRPVPTAAQ